MSSLTRQLACLQSSNRDKTFDKGKKLHGPKKHNIGYGLRYKKKTIYEAGGKENITQNTIQSNEQKASAKGIIELLSRFEAKNSNIQRVIDRLN